MIFFALKPYKYFEVSKFDEIQIKALKIFLQIDQLIPFLKDLLVILAFSDKWYFFL